MLLLWCGEQTAICVCQFEACLEQSVTYITDIM